MEQIRPFSDERLLGSRVYCGGPTESRDHVPSRVFLDAPYPENLPVVWACTDCNRSFSMDEEYVACLVECLRVGSTSATAMQRTKVRRILERKPALSARLAKICRGAAADAPCGVETDRVERVILKLARGHAAFELSEPQGDELARLTILPLSSVADDVRSDFETPPCLPIFPELGSRAMQRLAIGESGLASMWLRVQPGRYRYVAWAWDLIVVRLVVSEYLACQVVWCPQQFCCEPVLRCELILSACSFPRAE